METINDLARWLLERDDIAVIGHVSPDGDALGSGLAIVRALKAAGRRAAMVSADAVPHLYAFLPGAEEIVAPDRMPFVPRAILYEDVAAPDRAGDRGLLSAVVKECAVLDHHATNPGFCPLSLVRAEAAATGELALALIDALGAPLDVPTAVCLYTAIASDTGNFSFSNTTPSSLRAAARLLEAGLPLNEINRAVFRTRTRARTRLLGEALSAMRLYDEGRVAVTCVTQAMLQRCGALMSETEGIVNYLIEMEGTRAALLIEERRNGETKCSLRSDETLDVARLARAFGGGGHERAAGFSLNCLPEEAEQIAVGALMDALKGGA